MKTKRITFRLLQKYAPDRVREIEMAVDRAILYQGISIQFWQDVRLYGLDEAVTYLRGYAKKKLAYPAEVEKVAKLVKIVTTEVLESSDPSNGEPCFPMNEEPEGNGFDTINTTTPNDDE